MAELSEAQLLAMPEAEYMNARQMAFFRARLLAMKNELIDISSRTTADLRGSETLVSDPVDRATLEEEKAIELRARERDRRMLLKIGRALDLIATGDYGYCSESGDPIGLPRLLARPTATLTVEAQQRREQRQRCFG